MFSLFLFVCMIIQLIITSPTEVFDTASMSITNTFGSVIPTKTPLEFIIRFRTLRTIPPHMQIGIKLPRFTRNLIQSNVTNGNVTFGNVIVSPSYYYKVEWIEGHLGEEIPYSSSMLVIKTTMNATISALSSVSIKVYKENGIGAYCGFPSSTYLAAAPGVLVPTMPFEVFLVDPSIVRYIQNVTYTYHFPSGGAVSWGENVTFYRNGSFIMNDSATITQFTGVGSGCKVFEYCKGAGICDFCKEKCLCYIGFGAETDIIATGTPRDPYCQKRVCPSGKAVADIATSSNQAHAPAECSNQGVCNRADGTCQCYPPFTGSACDRLACPNNCSSHGQCLSMYDISVLRQEVNSARNNFIYGTESLTVAWDARNIFGCVCDSSWPVGYGPGETQLAEYFGPDCSLKRCPSGDDPFTSYNETNCAGISQIPGDSEIGKSLNLCHIDCSNRGTCDYRTGKCTCFPGSWGEACDKFSNAGSSARSRITGAQTTINGEVLEYTSFSGN